MTMVPSEIVANECLASLRARHLSRFLAHRLRPRQRLGRRG